jgi:hypothetical protein
LSCRYWPIAEGAALEVGDFVIRLQSRTQKRQYTVSHLVVLDRATKVRPQTKTKKEKKKKKKRKKRKWEKGKKEKRKKKKKKEKRKRKKEKML